MTRSTTFLPELADMTVLADPDGPLDDTVPANRPMTLRDLLTYTLGTGMVPAEPGTIPIADAMGVLYKAAPPDEWMGRLGALPLVHQPGERWMYETAANVTVVLIARATGRSFGAALRERVCDPLGMKDTAFSVPGESIGRLATAYARDNAATGGPVVDDAPDGHGASRRCSRVVAAGSSRPPTTTSPSPRHCSRAVLPTASGCSRGRR
jgi:Beta-lactamase class C and other penicillin binding proteins